MGTRDSRVAARQWAALLAQRTRGRSEVNERSERIAYRRTLYSSRAAHETTSRIEPCRVPYLASWRPHDKWPFDFNLLRCEPDRVAIRSRSVGGASRIDKRSALRLIVARTTSSARETEMESARDPN